MLERLASKSHYYFLDGFSSYLQIHIAPEDQEKTHSPVPLTLLPIGECPLAYAMPLVPSSGVCLAFSVTF